MIENKLTISELERILLPFLKLCSEEKIISELEKVFQPISILL